jgi:hypothetical protein
MSIHLSGNSLEAFCFSFAPCHWGEILPLHPKFLGGQMLFLFHFLFGDLTGQAIGTPN